MKMPRWNLLKQYYPAHDASVVFKSIGGKVELNYDLGIFNNACAARVSRALNKIGGVHSIPYIKDFSPNGKLESQVSSGSQKKWYIFRVKMLKKFLEKKYGKPISCKPAEYKRKLKAKKGIIVFLVAGWSDATGHADLWDGNKNLWKGYGSVAHEVLFWEAR